MLYWNPKTYLTLRYQAAWPGIVPETWYILIRTLNVGVKRFILWATGALHNSKKNRNHYACVFYFVDCYWLKFLMLTHNTPEMCTLGYFNSNVKMFPHTSGQSRHKNAYLFISLPKLLKRIFSLVIGHIFHLKFSAGSL